jgi:hypothetical protein
MGSNWSFLVTHMDIDTLVETDISSDVFPIPIFTDTGSGEANVARIFITGNVGKYITLAPIIDQFDRIRITAVDDAGGAYVKVFDVKRIIPIESKASGTTLQVELVGMEQHLQRMYYVGPRYFEDAFQMFEDIGDYYMANRKSKQPTLIGYNDTLYNKLPKYTVNTYDFGLNQEKCYTRMLQVIDKLGGSVEFGGILDYFELKFESSGFNYTELTAKVFSSGSTGSVVVESSSINNVAPGDTGQNEGGIDDIEGNNVFAWGEDDQGSLPIDYSKYKGAQQLFPFHPIWSSVVPYKTNSKVQLDVAGVNRHYLRTGADVVLPPLTPPAAGWTEITEAIDFGNVTDYSPWTRNKQGEWKSGFSNPDGALDTLFGQSAWDGNIVVFDEGVAQRTWADVIIPAGGSTADIPSESLFYGALSYRGLRVLLMGTGVGAFAGKDVYGNSKTKQVLEFGTILPDGTQGWFVKFPALITQPNAMVAVLQYPTFGSSSASKVYKYIGGVWTDVSSSSNGNECFHPYTTLENVDGVPGNRYGSVATDKNYKSAIRSKFIYNPGHMGIVDGLLPLGVNFSRAYYACGAWLNFRFPFPVNTFPGIPDGLGYLFGGQDFANFKTEPTTLDAENMNMLPDGTVGFNQVLSESYGQISAISFFTHVLYQYTRPVSGTLYTATEANFKVRCFVFDTDDNVVYQDFVVQFNDKFEETVLPLSGFQIYRGRRPKVWTDIFTPVKKQDVQNQFIWRNMKQICWQLQESYDAEGRFEPHFGRYVSNPNPTDLLELTPAFLIWGSDRYLTLTIDGFRFVKPLLVGSGVVTDRDIEVDFLERRTIGNYYQLKGEVSTELEKSQHRKTQFNISTPGKFDISFGQTFYYRNPRTVNFTDTGAPDGITANTVKLVAKKLEYSITKPMDGAGGFIRKIVGVRRFV